MENMRAMFVHSHVFLYDHSDIVYSEGKLTYDIWKRYLNYFNSLLVHGRYKEVNNASTYNISSGESVQHIKLPNLSDIRRSVKNYQECRRILTKSVNQVDLVIARLPSPYGNLAIEIAKKNGKPYVIELVGDVLSSLWYHGNFLGKLLAPISYLKTRKIVKSAPYILYVTQEFLQNRYPSNKVKITTACSNVEIDRSKAILKKSASYNDSFTIGIIGSYSSKYKGINTALEVVKKLIDDGFQVELRILGSGDAKKILNTAKLLGISEFIKLDGSLPAGRPVFEWLSKLDLYIQPSLTEGLPRALVEAMYCGLPCIASNVGGIPELLPVEFLHNPNDKKRMYELIKNMYYNENLRNITSKQNQHKAENYSKENLDQKRNEFWKDIIIDIKG